MKTLQLGGYELTQYETGKEIWVSFDQTQDAFSLPYFEGLWEKFQTEADLISHIEDVATAGMNF